VGVARSWRGGGGGTAPGEGNGAARRAQFDFACGVRTRGARAAWREAVLIARSFRGARRCRVISEASSRDPFVLSTLRQPRCMEWMARGGLLVTL